MTCDEQVTKRTRLLLDFDAVTPQPGIHANKIEHAEAIARADACRKWLTTEHGWPEPLWTDSGNGSGLIFGIDLANDADALELVSSVLAAAAKRWEDDRIVRAKCDVSVCNASRISRLIGTVNRKADCYEDRVWRTTRILASPERLEVVTTDQLRQVTRQAATTTVAIHNGSLAPRNRATGAVSENPVVTAWLTEQFGVRHHGSKDGAYRWELERCPWCADHSSGDGGAAVWRNADLTYGFRCMHDSCTKAKRCIKGLYDLGMPGADEQDAAFLAEMGLPEDPTSFEWNRPSAVKVGTDCMHGGHIVYAEPVDAEEEKAEKGKSKRAADILATLARDRAEFWHTADHVAYATLPSGGTVRIGSAAFKRWLALLQHDERGVGVGRAGLDEAVATLDAYAQRGPQREVHLRYARLGDRVEIDLGDETHDAVIITPAGWSVGPPSARFVRTDNLAPIPRPERGGSIDLLRPFVNVVSSDFPLVVGSVLDAMKGRGPYLVTVVTGPHGAAKSTLAELIRRLVDPVKRATLRALPGDERALAIDGTANHILAYDNVSHLSQWLSDALCRVATGGGVVARRLYTDDEQVIHDVCRPIVLNGIADVVTAPDLLSRSVLLRAEPIADKDRREKDEFLQAFSKVEPAILGMLYNAIAHGLAHLPSVRLPGLPRMADTAKWLAACVPAFDWSYEDWLKPYDGQRADAAEVAIEASTVAVALLEWWSQGKHSDWRGTASQLNAQLKFHALGERWPNTPKLLADELRRLAPILVRHGLRVDFRREADARLIMVSSLPTQS